ncbi:MAG TPA: hypothetical protein VFR58_00505 [Flavisolibacter sp.]|nr:hypothetical protein [Flavisolibacter sp.]
MKSLCLTLLLAAFSFKSTKAQCSSYYFMITGSEVVMTIYDKKGAESGKQTWKTGKVKKEGGASSSTVSSVLTDEKGKELAKGSGSFGCTGTSFKADLRMNLPQQQAEMFQDVETSVGNSYIEYPAAMETGQALSNANLDMDVKNKNGMSMKVSFVQTDRKVVSKETIESTAGTWQAYKITYKATITTRMGGIGIPFHFSAVEWFVPGFGIVKTETYSKKGKLMGSTLITSFRK